MNAMSRRIQWHHATLRDTKKRLAEAFPDLAYTIEPGRQGKRHLCWKGAPSVDEIAEALAGAWARDLSLSRTPTDAEQAIINARWEAERLTREAAEPALRAARKAEGLKAAAETRAAKKGLQARLAVLWPGLYIEVTKGHYGSFNLCWTGGPSIKDVRDTLESEGADIGRLDRLPTPEERAAAEKERREQNVKSEVANHTWAWQRMAGSRFGAVEPDDLSEEAKAYVARLRIARKLERAKESRSRILAALLRLPRNAPGSRRAYSIALAARQTAFCFA